MRIAWITDHLLYFNGGVRYIYEITRRLGDIKILVGDYSYENMELFAKQNIRIERFNYNLIGIMNNLRYWVLYPYYLLVNSELLKMGLPFYDVVISSSPTTHILCMMAGIKPILMVFELNPWLYSKEYQKGLSKTKRLVINFWKPIAQWIEKKAYKNASAIIVHSKFVQSEVKRVYGVDSIVIHMGVDTEFFKKQED